MEDTAKRGNEKPGRLASVGGTVDRRERAGGSPTLVEVRACDLDRAGNASAHGSDGHDSEVNAISTEELASARDIYTKLRARGEDNTVTRTDIIQAHGGDFKLFEQSDTDENGVVSEEEWIQFVETVASSATTLVVIGPPTHPLHPCLYTYLICSCSPIRVFVSMPMLYALLVHVVLLVCCALCAVLHGLSSA